MINTSPITALEHLEQYHIINGEMLEAGYRYAEICHLHPAGGPFCRSSKAFTLENSKRPKKEKDLEVLWHDLHKTLKSSPIKRMVERLLQDNDDHVLPLIYKSPLLQSLVREALENLAFCLKSYQ